MSPPGRSPTGTVTGSQSQTQRYSFGGGGDSASVALDTNNTVVETSIGLPSGVTLTKRASEEVWSYPNVHGDVVAVADETGAKQGATFTYDPYGSTLSAIPDNSAGSLDYGWLGQHQRGLEHATDLQPVIEMGARQYHPLLGRFLEVDPIEGGSCNDYDYVCADPINAFDLDGLKKKKKKQQKANHVFATFRRKNPGVGSSLPTRLFWGNPKFGVVHILQRNHFGGHIRSRTVLDIVGTTLRNPDVIRVSDSRNETTDQLKGNVEYHANWYQGSADNSSLRFHVVVVVDPFHDSVVTAYIEPRWLDQNFNASIPCGRTCD